MGSYKRGSGNYKSSYINVFTKPIDTSITSDNSVNDDPHLKMVLKPSTRYSGYMNLAINSGSTPDWHQTFKLISGSVGAYFGTVGVAMFDVKTFGTNLPIATTGNVQLHFLVFFVETGTAGGTLQFQWAQQNSDAGTTTLKKGSMMIVFEE